MEATDAEIRNVQRQLRNAKQEDQKALILGANPSFNRSDNNKDTLVFPRHQLFGMNRIAATGPTNPPRTVLTRSQLLECADSYTNDGIMRRLVNTLRMGVKGKRVKFAVEANEEITEFLEGEELQQLNNSITQNDRVPELRRKQIRIDKRCKLDDRLNTFLTNFFVFGRAIAGIVRFPTNDEFPFYGEPKAIQPLNTIRIENVEVDPVTYELTGVAYDFGLEKGKKIIRPTNMIFGVNDDNNLYDNTNYSGVSPVWTCLSTSQSNVVINDEDIPEATRQMAHKFGLLYAGTNKQAVIEQIRDQLQMGSWLVHNQEGLKADVMDLARSLTELPEVREMNAKYMTWCIAVPEFLIFESAANFATADKSIQTWKALVVDYYRTILQGILETYWYDPVLADHYGVKIEDVVTLRVKMKPIFEDLIFDSFKESVDANVALVNAGILTELQSLENMGMDKFVQQRRELDKKLAEQRDEDIRIRQEQIKQNGQDPNNQQNINPFQKQANNQRPNNNREAPK